MAGESSAISAPTPAPPASLTIKKMIADRAATAATNSRPRSRHRSRLVCPQESPLAACNQLPLAAPNSSWSCCPWFAPVLRCPRG